jgi:hypothetical protein
MLDNINSWRKKYRQSKAYAKRLYIGSPYRLWVVKLGVEHENDYVVPTLNLCW